MSERPVHRSTKWWHRRRGAFSAGLHAPSGGTTRPATNALLRGYAMMPSASRISSARARKAAVSSQAVRNSAAYRWRRRSAARPEKMLFQKQKKRIVCSRRIPLSYRERRRHGNKEQQLERKYTKAQTRLRVKYQQRSCSQAVPWLEYYFTAGGTACLLYCVRRLEQPDEVPAISQSGPRSFSPCGKSIARSVM